jgi:MFS family permease
LPSEWGIGRDALGVVLSMELIGMGFGSIVLGGAADRFGRRPTVLGCLVVMAVGMGLATTASSPTTLGGWRLLTGLGIGGMLAAINAVTAEICSNKGRSLAMSLMVIGYPIGATVGGTIAARCCSRAGTGAWCSNSAPLPRWCSSRWCSSWCRKRRGSWSAARPMRWTGRTARSPLRLPAVTGLPPVEPEAARASLLDILRPGLLGTTLLLTVGYSLHCITFYYILKWSPKIVADFGYTQPQAASVLVWANIGGAIGGGLFGFLMHRSASSGRPSPCWSRAPWPCRCSAWGR